MFLNISIDDISPHPQSSDKVLDRCFDLINIHPEIKFTLFIPGAYWRTVGPTATSKALKIYKYTSFCDTLKELPKENFELGYHGYYHGVPYRSNNDEFEKISYKEAEERFDLMNRAVKLSGLEFRPIFRPPAWRMCPAAMNAAEKSGIEIFTLAPFDYTMKIYKGAQENRKVIYCTSCPPAKPLKTDMINSIVYHACEWDKNYLNIDRTKELITFINNQDEVKFNFMEELWENQTALSNHSTTNI